MTEKEVYKVYDEIMHLTAKLYRIVPELHARNITMDHGYRNIQENVANMARVASAHLEEKLPLTEESSWTYNNKTI